MTELGSQACALAASNAEDVLASDEEGYPNREGIFRCRLKNIFPFPKLNNSSPLKAFVYHNAKLKFTS